MKHALFIPAAALVLLAACTEKSSNLVDVDEPFAAANGSPHFIGNASECEVVGTTLQCTFKEAGLSSGQTVEIELTVNASATYQCINGGGENPNDQKKSTVNSEVSDSEEFTAGKNGNVIGTLTVEAPPSDISCPPGQTLTLISVSFGPGAALINDLTTGASLSLTDF